MKCDRRRTSQIEEASKRLDSEENALSTADWIDPCGQLVLSSELISPVRPPRPPARSDRPQYLFLPLSLSCGTECNAMDVCESSDVSVWRWRSIAPRVRILKNLLMLASCLSAAVGATLAPLLTYLACSVELKALAPVSLLVFHSAAMVSHLTGRAVLRLCRHKISIVMGLLPFFVLVAATTYAHYMTLIPAAALLGLTQGPLWSASFGYLVGMAKQFGYYSDQTDMGIVPMLLSFFNACIALGEFFGYSLTAGAFMALEMVENRSTKAWSPYDWAECGRRFCNRAEQRQWPSLVPMVVVDDESTWEKLMRELALRSTIVPIYCESLFICFVTFSVCVASFPLGKLTVRSCDLESLHRERPRPRLEVLQILMVRLLRWWHLGVFLMTVQSSKFHCILPLTVFLGWSEAFLHADITKAFIACIMPQSLLGSVMGVSSCITVFLYVFLVAVLQHTSRLTTVYGAAIVGLGSVAVMWMWKPMSDDQPILYVIACSWRMMTTVMKVAVQTVTYLLFPDRVDLALAAYNTCYSLGAAASFSLFVFDCFATKLCACAALLIVSLMPYTWLEIKYISCT